MSRIGKMPITIPAGVSVTVREGGAAIVGQKGNLEVKIPSGVEVKVEKDRILVTAPRDKNHLQGLVRALVVNAITGINEGWSKTVELSGTGYRASVADSDLQLALGFSHPVTVKAPAGVTFEVKDNKITVFGSNKETVGETAAIIRGLRPADPYKAKGFTYQGEIIVRKAGKAAKAGITGVK